ncbi:hypothetical protein FRC06_008045 [Ceratobasidium sp. 370]|nr:hypothetical protein FRC06_008045 [Ceratobasidium sp. 370]
MNDPCESSLLTVESVQRERDAQKVAKSRRQVYVAQWSVGDDEDGWEGTTSDNDAMGEPDNAWGDDDAPGEPDDDDLGDDDALGETDDEVTVVPAPPVAHVVLAGLAAPLPATPPALGSVSAASHHSTHATLTPVLPNQHMQQLCDLQSHRESTWQPW